MCCANKLCRNSTFSASFFEFCGQDKGIRQRCCARAHPLSFVSLAGRCLPATAPKSSASTVAKEKANFTRFRRSRWLSRPRFSQRGLLTLNHTLPFRDRSYHLPPPAPRPLVSAWTSAWRKNCLENDQEFATHKLAWSKCFSARSCARYALPNTARHRCLRQCIRHLSRCRCPSPHPAVVH